MMHKEMLIMKSTYMHYEVQNNSMDCYIYLKPHLKGKKQLPTHLDTYEGKWYVPLKMIIKIELMNLEMLLMIHKKKKMEGMIMIVTCYSKMEYLLDLCEVPILITKKKTEALFLLFLIINYLYLNLHKSKLLHTLR